MSAYSDNESEDKSHKSKHRERIYSSYLFGGQRVCRRTYQFLLGVGKDRLQAIKASYMKDGITTRTHGNTKKLPHNALTFEDITRIVKFLSNYAKEQAILLPGRVPGYKRDDFKLLPSSTSKKVHVQYKNKLTKYIFTQQIWRLYCDSCAMNGDKATAYQSFCKYWLQLQPNIRIGKPMSDLCWTCQQNSTMIARSINKSEEEKSEVNCILFSTTMSHQYFWQ